jgi:FKBP-type peptidyl-prolyl cis-trans isomerase SlyD
VQQLIKQRMIGWFTCGALLWAMLGTGSTQPTAPEAVSAVSGGTRVSLEYTLRLNSKDNPEVLESNVGGEPFIYLQGSQQVVPGLEKALEGMKVGEQKAIAVPPEEGYGVVDKEALTEVDKAEIPADAQTVGATLQGQTAEGQVMEVKVVEVKDTTVVLDLNHPLAGKTLYFDIKVLDIQKPTTP